MLTSYEGITEKHETTTRAIRIDSDLEKTLVRLAAKERMSVNSLINGALRKYTEWDFYALKFGMITNSIVAAKRLISHLNDDEVRELGSWVGENSFKDFMVFLGMDLNLEDALRAIELMGSNGNYMYEEYINKVHRVVVCKHNLGAQWSLYYENMFKSLFEKTIGVEVSAEHTEDQFVLKLPLRVNRGNDFFNA